MNIDLTPKQNADRERLGACVVPAPVEYEIWDYPITDDSVPRVEFRPHGDWLNAAAPCQTCDGTDKVRFPAGDEWPGREVVGGCPDCRDGKPIIEIRVTCPVCGGTTRNPDNDDFKCPSLCEYNPTPGSVVAARATVTLLPVWDVHDDTKDHHILHVCIQNGVAYLDGGATRALPFDPLPVAGRDWVAVFEDDG